MNKIHDTVIIEGDVIFGQNNTVLPYTTLTGPLIIGDNNIIGPHTVIGSPGQDTKNRYYDSSQKKIIIGSNNIIREFSTVQKPVCEDLTEIGNNVYLMSQVHIPHDVVLQNDVVITPMAVIGGTTRILRGANIAIGAAISQYSVIGHYSIVAMGAPVVKNIKPFSRYIPGKPISVNLYALKKFGFMEHLDEIKKYVLEDIFPKSDNILSTIEEFISLHEKSGKRLY